MSGGKKYDFLFFDSETTGHDPLAHSGRSIILWHEIIDIGAIAVSSKTLEVLEDFEVKVLPEHPERCLPNLINHYPERAKNGEWDGAETLSSAIDKFLGFCGNLDNSCILIGQNFSFDWSFLFPALVKCGITEEVWSKYFHYGRLDTRSMTVQQFANIEIGYNPSDFSLRSGLIQKRLGIPAEPEPHTALNGAYQAYELFRALQKEKTHSS